MDIQTHYLEVTKTARYSTFGNLSAKTKYFWFVLHGSDMRCEQMLYKFSQFDPEEHFVVAPEGMNRFYAEGFYGDVVASWMTKRDRLYEIHDFSLYLSELYRQYSQKLPANCKKIVMGFSQGGTTIYRWLHRLQETVDILFSYSGWIPEDIDLTQAATSLDKIQKILTYGTSDQYLKEDRIAALNAVIEKNNLDISIHPSEGDHRVNRENLTRLFHELIK